MKLFIVGPVEMYDCVLKLRRDFPYFRTDGFSKIMKDNANKLSTLLNCQAENILFFAMTGTGAMEATVQNCIFEHDKCLVINGGTFGQRFCDILAYHNKSYDEIKLEWNEKLTAKHLQPFENKGYTTLLVNLHETSTGQLYDINLLSDFCKKNHLKFIVDAISTFLADDYDMDKYGIDATIISSQKGLCCSVGMTMIAISDKLKNDINKYGNKPTTLYFNFEDYFKNLERWNMPYTPPVGIVYEVNEMLKLITSTTKDVWLKNVKDKALYFRDQANKHAIQMGFEIPTSYSFSNFLTPIYFKDNIATDIINILREDYDIYVHPIGGKLANNLVKVSHIGNTNFNDIDDLLEKMLITIKKIRSRK